MGAIKNERRWREYQRVNRYGMPPEGWPLKTCPGCGVVFRPNNRRQIYHTKACGVAYKYRLRREETAKKREQYIRDRVAYVDGDVIKIPLSGRYLGSVAIIDNTPKNQELIAGRIFSCDAYGYPMTRIEEKSIHLHHIVFGKPTGRNVVDHINGDKLDCRLCNLREVDRSTNNFNQPPRRHNTSGKTGVYKGKRSNGEEYWYARIYKQKVQYNLGIFENFEDAVAAREVAELELYGDITYADSNPRNSAKSNLRVVSRTFNRSRKENSRRRGSRRNKSSWGV